MLQERVQILVRLSTVLLAETRDPVRIGSPDGGDFDARNRTRCARMGIRNIPTAD
jgi:hypothetical protein